MLSLNKKQKIWMITATIVVVVGALILQSSVLSTGAQGSQEQPAASTTTSTTATDTPVQVQTITTQSMQSEDVITVSGEVRAGLTAAVSSQTSGVVQSVPAEIGSKVQRGDVLARFENASQQAAVQQAQASVEQQQARLDQLVAGARPLELENTRLSVQTARTNLQQARTSLFNTDLQAYVAEGESAVRSGTLQAPIISGTYEGDERGEYRISLYRSNSKSGYSFRYSGLESGIGTVSTDTPQPLGTRGLYIQFPNDFAKNKLLTWVVPIPNTRSNQYSSARTNFRQAQTQLEQAENNLELSQSGARSEEVQAARAQLDSTQASLASAQAELAKTIVRAPFGGTVLSVSAEPGEYISVGQPVARVIDETSFEIRTSVGPETARRITVGDTATFGDDKTARVIAVAPAVNNETGNVEVRLRPTGDTQLTAGTYVDLTFRSAAESNQTTLPLSAVGTTANGAYVLVLKEDNTLERVSVQTESITGNQVSIAGGLPDRPIVRDISGLSAGQAVTTAGDE